LLFDNFKPALSEDIKRYLQITLKLDLEEFVDVIPFVRDQCIKDLREFVLEQKMTLDEPLPDVTYKQLYEVALNAAKLYLDRIAGQEVKLEKLGKGLKDGYAIVVIGAGLSSEAGLPVASELDEGAFVSYHQAYPSVEREQCFDENGKLEPSIWKKIKRSHRAYNFFVQWFSNKCNDPNVNPARSHGDLIHFYQKGRFLELLCLNWDNLIEKAHRKYNNGRDIPTTVFDKSVDGDQKCGRLWKLCGCVEHPELGTWVLPGFSGKLPSSLVSCIKAYNRKATDYIVISIGYSEESEEGGRSVAKQIKSVTKPRQVIPIRPDLAPDAPKNVIIGTASHALNRLRFYFGN